MKGEDNKTRRVVKKEDTKGAGSDKRGELMRGVCPVSTRDRKKQARAVKTAGLVMDARKQATERKGSLMTIAPPNNGRFPLFFFSLPPNLLVALVGFQPGCFDFLLFACKEKEKERRKRCYIRWAQPTRRSASQAFSRDAQLARDPLRYPVG